MKTTNPPYHRGFTLMELILVIAIIGILAALLLPVLSAVQSQGKRATCLSNVKQINMGVRMYCEDAADAPPAAKNPWIAYKQFIEGDLGARDRLSPGSKIFVCPADLFCYEMMRGANGHFNVWTNLTHGQHERAAWDYSSYSFNGFNAHTNDNPQHAAWLGIADRKITSVKHPVQTVLVAETPAFYPYSWHQPRKPIQLAPGGSPMFNNAKDVVSFVDGHADYIKMYYEKTPGNLLAVFYNPPAGYQYKWSGN